MKIKCHNIKLQYNENKEPEIILSTKGRIENEISELKEILTKGKELAVEIKQYRNHRSLDANALLWKMCGEIANILRTTKDEVYLTMLERYGVFTHVIVKKEAVQRIKQEWRTVRELGEVTINGKIGIQLQCYYGSHLYDSKEFSVLLDGVISEARELGIEIISQDEKNLLLSEWGNKNE